MRPITPLAAYPLWTGFATMLSTRIWMHQPAALSR